MLFFYGYTNHQNQTNSNAFFKFDDINEADLANFSKFKSLNEEALKACTKKWDGKLFRCNKDIPGAANIEEWKQILSLPAKLTIKETH